MTEWLKLSDEDRLISLQQANIKSGISAKVIEKDWWVTLVLKAVFAGKYAAHLSFKGGTSLSKGWHLIDRFSEDIDLAIDRGFLGFDDKLSKSTVKRLKRAACEFTSAELKAELEHQLSEIGVPAGMLTITAEAVREDFPDTDPQILWIAFPSLLGKVKYIEDRVKLEVSARSLNEPSVEQPILSLLGEYMPGFPWSGLSFIVPTVEAKRSFMEKAFLLHEEFLRPIDKIVYLRMSRHLSDLERLMDTEHAATALADFSYYKAIVEHRRHMIFKTGVDYDTHYPQTINFIPPDGILAAFEQDYALMKEQMLYGDNNKEFAQIMERLRELLDLFKKAADN